MKTARKSIKKSIDEELFENMFKPKIKLVIENADKLDVSPEEYEKIKQRNALSLNQLNQDHPDVRNKHTDI